MEPLFPFGHGLSYTTFEYSGLKVSTPRVKAGRRVAIGMQVRNSGTRAGTEVVRLYLRDVESSLPRSEKELKGFGRVMLQPGEARTLAFTLDPSALAFFDAGLGRNFEALDPLEWLSRPEAEKPPPPVREVLRVAGHGDGWGVPADWESA